jgi:regulator of sigma E protease
MGSEVAANMLSLGSGFLGYLLPFLFVLTIVVFFHELGHFLVARWVGVRVLVFSLGFGPELLGFTDRHGTRWKLSAIPLGGYVKFFGDQNAASVPDQDSVASMTKEERAQSFFYKSVPRRAAVVAAGPIANFILAVLIFAGIFMLYGKPSTSPRVDSIQAGGAAEAAGFKPGDIILSINGQEIQTFAELQRVVTSSAGQTLQVAVNRGGENLVLKAVPELKEMKDSFGNVHRVGVLGITRSMGDDDQKLDKAPPFTALKLGVAETWFVVERTMTYLGGVITGREAADQLGGPIRIAQVSGQVATVGMVALIHLTAVLSVSIGLLNLFPIPLLDGGHLLFYAIEVLRGRPLSERAQELGFRFGLALVLVLMIFATYNDVTHLPWPWS